MLPRAARLLALVAFLLAVGGGVARAALVPAGWAPGGVPSTPARLLLAGDVSGAAAGCGENAALLVRVGTPTPLRRWSVAVGDALVAKGWSVHDLAASGTSGRAALRDLIGRAAARCRPRRILLASYGGAVAPTRRAIDGLSREARGQIVHVDEVARGRVAWSRVAAAAVRPLRRWPTPSLDDTLTGVPQVGPLLGDPQAPVVLETFDDLQCPFCREYALQVLPRLVARYVRDGEVQIRSQLVSFIGVDSVRAAQLAYAAGLQDRLWNVMARFYEGQREENSGYVTDAFLRRVAARAGLDVEQAMNDRGTSAVRVAVRSAADRFRQTHLTGVPSLEIGRADGRGRVVDADWSRPSVVEGAIQRALRVR